MSLVDRIPLTNNDAPFWVTSQNDRDICTKKNSNLVPDLCLWMRKPDITLFSSEQSQLCTVRIEFHRIPCLRDLVTEF